MPTYTPPLKRLICGDLHYCCLWCFFSLYRRTSLIALRLGCSRQAVAKHKARCRDGVYKCEGKASCMRDRLKKAGRL